MKSLTLYITAALSILVIGCGNGGSGTLAPVVPTPGTANEVTPTPAPTPTPEPTPKPIVMSIKDNDWHSCKDFYEASDKNKAWCPTNSKCTMLPEGETCDKTIAKRTCAAFDGVQYFQGFGLFDKDNAADETGYAFSLDNCQGTFTVAAEEVKLKVYVGFHRWGGLQIMPTLDVLGGSEDSMASGSSPAGTWKYTLDGSEPTIESQAYPWPWNTQRSHAEYAKLKMAFFFKVQGRDDRRPAVIRPKSITATTLVPAIQRYADTMGGTSAHDSLWSNLWGAIPAPGLSPDASSLCIQRESQTEAFLGHTGHGQVLTYYAAVKPIHDFMLQAICIKSVATIDPGTGTMGGYNAVSSEYNVRSSRSLRIDLDKNDFAPLSSKIYKEFNIQVPQDIINAYDEGKGIQCGDEKDPATGVKVYDPDVPSYLSPRLAAAREATFTLANVNKLERHVYANRLLLTKSCDPVLNKFLPSETGFIQFHMVD